MKKDDQLNKYQHNDRCGGGQGGCEGHVGQHSGQYGGRGKGGLHQSSEVDGSKLCLIHPGSKHRWG